MMGKFQRVPRTEIQRLTDQISAKKTLEGLVQQALSTSPARGFKRLIGQMRRGVGVNADSIWLPHAASVADP